jgi:O-antigen ligase
VYVALGKSPGPKFAKLAILGAITVPVLIASPFGSKIIDLLPFVGTVDEHNVSYRADFTRISIGHILDNPLFGDPYFNDAAVMEELKPQGLLDTLNIFIAVGLGSGLTGMSLFSGVFIVAGAGVFKCMRRQADRTGELYHLGQVLFSTFVGLVVILCTISGISFIPMIYWTVVGLCISYARMLEPTKVAENVVGGSASPKTMIRSLPAPGINMVDSSPRRQGINGPLVARHKK